MPPYMTTLQFIVVTSTSAVSGNMANTKTGIRKARAPMLIANPYRPKVQRWGGKGWPRSRLTIRQEMVIMYEVINEVIVRETIANRATSEPILIRERRTVMTRETMTELSGMFHPGVTCQGQLA